MKFVTLARLSITASCLAPLAWAGDVLKANNGTSLSQTGSWSVGVLPGSSDVAVWDSSYTFSNQSLASTLGTSTTWNGIRVTAPTNVPRIRNTAGAVLTLGAAGIDMSAGAGNFEIHVALKAGSNQSWNIASGRTLIVQNDLQGTGVTITKSGGGILNLAGTALNYQGGLTLSEGSVQVTNASDTAELSGALGGSGTLAKSGAGALTLTGNNASFSGGVTLSAGQLNLNHAMALGSGKGTISGGSIDNTQGSPLTLGGGASMAWNGNFSFLGSSPLDLGSTTISVAGSRSVTVSGDGLVLGGALTGDSTAALTKLGSGILEVKSGASIDLEGKFAVGGGILRITGGMLACGATSGNLELTGGSTVELNGGTLSVPAVVRTGATGHIRFNGGTLKPRADSLTFMTGLDTAYVAAGGMVVDLDGHHVTVAQPLQHDPALAATADGGLRLRDALQSGVFTLNAANTYTGPTVIESGTLALGAAGSLAGSPLIDVQAAAVLDGLQGATIAAGQTLQGTGTLNGTLTVAAGATISPSGTTIGSLSASGSLKLAGTAAFQINKTGGVLTCDRISGGYQVTYGGTLTVTSTGGAGSLVNGNTFTLFEAGGYGGAFTTFNLPTLVTGLYWDTSRLAVDGTIEVVNTLPTPNFSLGAGSYIGAQSVTISSLSGSTIHYTLDGGNPTVPGPNVFSAPSPVTGVVIPSDVTNFTIKAYATKAGASSSPVATAVYSTLTHPVWIWDGGGNWSDPLNWRLGVVAEGSGISADFSTLTLTSASTVTLDSSRTIGQLKFGDVAGLVGWTLAGTTGASLILDSGSASPVINVVNQTAAISVTLAGSHGLTKTGEGTLVLSNPGKLSGDIIISQGMLRTGIIPSGTIILGDANSGAARLGWQFQGGTQPSTNVVVNNQGTGAVSLGTYSSGIFSGATGTLTLQRPVTINDQTGDRTTYSGKISGNVGSITITGSRVTFGNASNDFTGDLIVSAGSIYQNDNPTALPATTSLANSGTFRLNNGGTHALNAVDGPGGVTIIAGGDTTLSLGNSNGSGSIGGVISNGAATLTLIKKGTGIQTFAGANTYTGTTTVSAGTLLVTNTAGSGTGTGAVTVNTGATLGGTGSIAGGVTVNAGASLAPGTEGVGTLSTGALTLAGAYPCQVSGAVTDRLAVSGNLVLTGASLTVSTIAPATLGTYVIATYSGTLTGTFASVTPGYTVDYTTPNQVKLIATGGGGSGYDTWVGGYGLTGSNALSTADPDHDGIANGVEFVIGGNPATVQDASLLPTITLVNANLGSGNQNYLRFTYRRTKASADALAAAACQYNPALGGTWTTATSGVDGVVIQTTPNGFGTSPPVDRVDVHVPQSLSAAGKLFGRLRAIVP